MAIKINGNESPNPVAVNFNEQKVNSIVYNYNPDYIYINPNKAAWSRPIKLTTKNNANGKISCTASLTSYSEPTDSTSGIMSKIRTESLNLNTNKSINIYWGDSLNITSYSEGLTGYDYTLTSLRGYLYNNDELVETIFDEATSSKTYSVQSNIDFDEIVLSTSYTKEETRYSCSLYIDWPKVTGIPSDAISYPNNAGIYYYNSSKTIPSEDNIPLIFSALDESTKDFYMRHSALYGNYSLSCGRIYFKGGVQTTQNPSPTSGVWATVTSSRGNPQWSEFVKKWDCRSIYPFVSQSIDISSTSLSLNKNEKNNFKMIYNFDENEYNVSVEIIIHFTEDLYNSYPNGVLVISEFLTNWLQQFTGKTISRPSIKRTSAGSTGEIITYSDGTFVINGPFTSAGYGMNDPFLIFELTYTVLPNGKIQIERV